MAKIKSKVKAHSKNSLSVETNYDDAQSVRVSLAPHEVKALRKYFLEEQDKKLNRWRDPEDKSMLCYRDNYDRDAIWVFNEETPEVKVLYNNPSIVLYGTRFSETAQRFFDEHRAITSSNMPWCDARQWEAWALTIDEKEEAYRVGLGSNRELFFACFTKPTEIVSLEDNRITAGYRIWPKEDSK